MERVDFATFTEKLQENLSFLVVAFSSWYQQKIAAEPEIWKPDLTWEEWQHALAAFLLESGPIVRIVESTPPHEVLPTFVPPVRRHEEESEPPKPPPEPESERPLPPPWARVQGRD